METSTPREETNSKNIEIHLELNKREEEIINNFTQLDILKDEACNICKICLDEYSLSVEKSICQNCMKKSSFNKKYNGIFISSWLVGSVTTSFVFGFNGYACVTAGLSAGTILSTLYKMIYT